MQMSIGNAAKDGGYKFEETKWNDLGRDLQLLVVSALRPDTSSLQAVMETSRDLRIAASSMVSHMIVQDDISFEGDPWLRFPRHATPSCLELYIQWGADRPTWAEEDLARVRCPHVHPLALSVNLCLLQSPLPG